MDSIINQIGQKVQQSELTNENLIEIINVCGSFLNLKTIPDYAKSEKISYNGVKSRIKLNKVQECNIFGNRMIIDNE